MRIRHIRYAEALLDGGATNPRMYLFDFRRPGLDGVERAGHGSDMPFFFDNLDKAPASDGPHGAPLVRAMSGALVALARSGDPNHDAIPALAGLRGQRPSNDGLRRRIARRERPDVGGATRLGRSQPLGGG